jgi:hypothetical protein
MGTPWASLASLPRSWTIDPQRLDKAGVPDDLDFATRPALAPACSPEAPACPETPVPGRVEPKAMGRPGRPERWPPGGAEPQPLDELRNQDHDELGDLVVALQPVAHRRQVLRAGPEDDAVAAASDSSGRPDPALSAVVSHGHGADLLVDVARPADHQHCSYRQVLEC